MKRCAFNTLTEDLLSADEAERGQDVLVLQPAPGGGQVGKQKNGIFPSKVVRKVLWEAAGRRLPARDEEQEERGSGKTGTRICFRTAPALGSGHPPTSPVSCKFAPKTPSDQTRKPGSE